MAAAGWRHDVDVGQVPPLLARGCAPAYAVGQPLRRGGHAVERRCRMPIMITAASGGEPNSPTSHRL